MLVLEIIVFSIFSWFIQNIIHEMSHLFYALFIEKYNNGKIIPWPHKYNNVFYFARYELYGTPKYPDLEKDRHIAPIFGSLIFITVWFCISVLINLNIILILIPITASIIDILFWLWGYFFGSENCDGKKYRNFK